MDKKIREIITYHSDEGTSGYLLSEKQIEELKQLFLTEMKSIIGEDEEVAYFQGEQAPLIDEVADIRNNFRKELRAKIKQITD